MEISHLSEHGGQSEKWLKIRNGERKKRNEAAADGEPGDSDFFFSFCSIEIHFNLLPTMSLFTCVEHTLYNQNTLIYATLFWLPQRVSLFTDGCPSLSAVFDLECGNSTEN